MNDRCVTGHTVQIVDRGGSGKIAQLRNLTSVEWGRVLEGKSLSTIKLTGRNCDQQADELSKIQARRHELVVFRGGDRVWEGPIKTVNTTRGYAEITAADGSEYLDFTPLSKAWPLDTGTPGAVTSARMTYRVATILAYELATAYSMIVGTGGAAHTVTVPRWEGVTPPANLLPNLEVRHSETLLTRSDTLPFEMSVGEHLYNLSEGGLAYTWIGRKLLVWDVASSIGSIKTLTEADFYGDPSVRQSGGDHWSISHRRAQQNEDAAAPSVGNAGGPDDYYGVWTHIVSSSEEDGADAPTQDALNSQTQRDLVGRNPVPLTLSLPTGAGLRLGADLTINHLVPGVEVPVLAKLNLRQMSQRQRLSELKVTETADGEKIAVTLIPVGEAVAA